ncbi:MAG: 2-dehydropantoate 2-reductase [Gammaproteobacteria bacterium]
MRICVYGCGAIGGLLAARLSLSGAIVSVVARGKQLQAINENGLTLINQEGEESSAFVMAAEDPTDLGPQDVVFLTMKAHQVPAVAAKISLLLSEDTMVVTAANGLPWWYFHGISDELGTPELKTVDPGRRLWSTISPQRAVGCVIYPAASVIEPGVIRHLFGDQFALGEPNREASPRLATVSAMLGEAGFVANVQSDIRADIWTKLVANAAFNPVSVITGKTLGSMIKDQAIYTLLERVMNEVVEVAASLGIEVVMQPRQLLEATRQLGDHKTSMLQDFQVGRPLELEPIVGAVAEVGKLKGIETPSLNAVSKLVLEKSKQS